MRSRDRATDPHTVIYTEHVTAGRQNHAMRARRFEGAVKPMSDDDSGDELLTWPDALRLINEGLSQVFSGAETLRHMADAAYLELSDATRAHLLYVTSLTLNAPNFESPERQGKTPSPDRSDKSPIRLIGPDDVWGRPIP
jgi:hypothetical protein